MSYLINKPLMRKPSDREIYEQSNLGGIQKLDYLEQNIFKGNAIGLYEEDIWIFPDGVKEKIKNNKFYKIWYYSRTASDPQDNGVFYKVYYIEEVHPLKLQLIECLEKLLEELK